MLVNSRCRLSALTRARYSCIIQLLYLTITFLALYSRKGALLMELKHIRLIREAMLLLQRNLSWQWKSEAICCGITVAQCHTLLEVGKSGEIAQVKLASILGIDSSTLSRTIDGMVQAGLVERKAKPDDRRFSNIILAEQGKEIYERINLTSDHYYAEIFSGIPPEKHREVVESITLLAEAINNSSSSECCAKELSK